MLFVSSFADKGVNILVLIFCLSFQITFLAVKEKFRKRKRSDVMMMMMMKLPILPCAEKLESSQIKR